LILGHVGFEAFSSLRAIRRAVPFREPVRVWLRRVPRAEIPVGEEAQVEWLYREWERLDAAIDARSVGPR
jgi:hypothetical protein